MNSLQIEERAGQWLARRDSSDWSKRDEAELQTWLAQSTAHVVAFIRLEAAWKQARRLKALSAGVPLGQVPEPEKWQLAPFFTEPDSLACGDPLAADGDARIETRPNLASGAVRRRSMLFRALAATALLAAVGGVVWHFSSAGPDYSTPVGGLASVPMSDGSKVTLNTDSHIRVAVTETERRVELQQGEAFFEVSKDPNRPFVVIVGSKRVVAVGTAFVVRRMGDEVRVAIAEGRVRLEDATEQATEQSTEEAPARNTANDGILTLSAGSVARASEAGVLVQEKPLPEIQSDLSWRTGYLIFRDTPLADAVAEFSRYSRRQIIIEDPAVAAIRVSGKFRSTQSDAFVRLLEEGFPIRAENAGDRIVLNSR